MELVSTIATVIGTIIALISLVIALKAKSKVAELEKTINNNHIALPGAEFNNNNVDNRGPGSASLISVVQKN